MNIEERDNKIEEIVNEAIDKTRLQIFDLLHGLNRIGAIQILQQAIDILNTQQVEDIQIELKVTVQEIGRPTPGIGYHLDEAADKVAKLLKE